MSVRQLAAILAELEPDAIIDVRVEGQPDGDWHVAGFVPLHIPHGPNAGSWVTLLLENAR